MKRTNSCAAVVMLVALALTWPLASLAQAYPNKPIRLIVAFSPGGSNDIISRLVGQKLGEALGQPVVIENRPGAGGAIGTDFVVKSPPDGYTLLMGAASTLAVNVSAYPKRGFDPLKHVTPITLVASAPFVMVVHPSVPAKSIAELIALAKARPGQLNFSSSGKGSSLHLSAELFKMMSTTELVHVPYKGGGQAVIAAVTNEVQITFNDLAPLLPHLKAGSLRALAVTSAGRFSLAPELPTIAESGLAGYESTSWFGIVAPAGLPKDIQSRLHGELVRIVHSQEMKKRFAGLGIEGVTNSPEEFAALIRAQIDKWAVVVNTTGSQAE
jgi:tripartite-type tricarboxylate transporter receptor subunit TctC